MCDGLPLIPGFRTTNLAKNNFPKSQSLDLSNGYSIPKTTTQGINDTELSKLANYMPTLTYGPNKNIMDKEFVPNFVALDKKVLKFYGFFKQSVYESPNEQYRVRPIEVLYFIEDDTICVYEPEIKNSGLLQGKLIQRQRIPKNDFGDTYTWKDLNNGINVTFYGRTFRLSSCDPWTKEFLTSEGIDVNEFEDIPHDPYIYQRQETEKNKESVTPSNFDKLKQFLELDRKVLRFYAMWDDRENMFGNLRPFIIHYYLVDDTLEIREIRANNDGYDPYPILVNRHKIPKNRQEINPAFPIIYLELSEKEIPEYITPEDFMIGQTVVIYNRRFIIYDLDNFTKAYYWKTYGINDFTPLNISRPALPLPKMEIPPYNGFGSIEDSLQSCLSLIPETEKKDYIRMLENDGIILRFKAKLENNNENDKKREFIISFFVADDTIEIFDTPKKNSGFPGGKFLERRRVLKQNAKPETPSYFGPEDFKIGNLVIINSYRFRIIDADDFVLTYLNDNLNKFSGEFKSNITLHFENKSSHQPYQPNRSNEELESITTEISHQLKKLAIIDKSMICEMFRKYKKNHTQYLSKQNIKAILQNGYYPSDDQIVENVYQQFHPKSENGISLEEFRKFMESRY